MVEKTDRENSEIMLHPGMHIHLVGIGGAGLSAIARVLLEQGFVVSGSDRQLNERTAELATNGAVIFQGHQAGFISGADVLLISSAVPADNPEVVAALAAGVPVMKRADFLGRLMADRVGIGVAGSHGKTTTTGMIAQILIDAGLDPTVIVGGVMPLLGSNGRAGQGAHFLVEADEYDHMFLGLRPQLAVITNVEYDHPDLFPTVEIYRDAFARFTALLPPGGRLVLCADDPGAALLASEVNLTGVTVETYGLEDGLWRALDLRSNQLGGTDFLVQKNDQVVGLARLRLPGEHNVRNALAAVAVADGLGVDFPAIRQALAAFGGVGRRFQLVGEAGDVAVIDDYAHHPTEIRATLAAARQRYAGRRLWAVWQPHTFSRLKALLAEFATCFRDADRVLVLDIYRSREKETLGIDETTVLAALQHDRAEHISGLAAAADYILDRVRPGDVILTLTAGDGNVVGRQVLAGLQARLGDGPAPVQEQQRLED